MLSKYFTKLAGLGAAAAITATLISLFPRYADPELAHFIPPPTGRSIFKINDPIFTSYDQLQYGSVYEALDCANDNPVDFSADTSKHELKSSFNKASGNQYRQLCVWSEFDPFKDTTREEKYSISADEYLNDNQFTMQRYFQENFESSARYKSWEREKMDAAATAIAADPVIQNAYQQWKSQADYADINEAGEQYKLKKETFQRVVDHVRHSFGLETIDVSMYVFSAEQRGTLAFYNPGTDSIAVNYGAYGNVTNSLHTGLIAIIEEAKHSVDAAISSMYMRGEIGNDDVRTEHAAAIWLNYKQYNGAQNGWRFDTWDHIRTLGQPAYNAYKAQYIERNAKEFSSALTGKILENLECGEDGNAFGCVKQKTLNLF